MKKKMLTIGLPIIGGLIIASVGIASAAGMFGGGPRGAMGFVAGGFPGVNSVTPTEWASNQSAQFQSEASALGLDESVIVTGWANGESLGQIATANGISSTQLQTDMKNYAESQQKADLDALVTQGTITSAQETQYLQSLATAQAKMQNASGTWQGGGFGRMHGKPPASVTPTQ